MARTMRKVLLGVPLLATLVVFVFAASPCLATCGGHDEVVTAAVQACPRARELLGDDAGPARFGCANGSTEVTGDMGDASWSMPYTGARGRGTVTFDAHKLDGTWRLARAALEVDDERVDLLACSGIPGPAQLAQTNADAMAGTFDGKVIRSTHPTISSGSPCTGDLARDRGGTTARVIVRCTAGALESGGEVAIYDGRGTFTLDVGDAARRDDDRSEYDDALTSGRDGTPGCRLSSAGAHGTLTIWDASPDYEIVVAL